MTCPSPRCRAFGAAGSTAAYFDEALRQTYFPDKPENVLKLRREDDGTIAFEPPPDLVYRLKSLPKSYLTDQGILPTSKKEGRLRLTFDRRGSRPSVWRSPGRPPRASGPTSVTCRTSIPSWTG
ncbi:hypothetical protein SMICM17S_00347 [Streptomyces microflavus]